jgi:hypothetical protein
MARCFPTHAPRFLRGAFFVEAPPAAAGGSTMVAAISTMSRVFDLLVQTATAQTSRYTIWRV